MESFLEEEAFELGFGEWRHLEEAEMESCREEGVPAEGSARGRLEGEFSVPPEHKVPAHNVPLPGLLFLLTLLSDLSSSLLTFLTWSHTPSTLVLQPPWLRF